MFARIHISLPARVAQRAGLCIGAALCIAAAAAQDAGTAVDGVATLRSEFQAAYARASAGANVTADSAALRGYVLYPYLQAERLRIALAAATAPDDPVDAAAAAFLAAHAGEPVARALRGQWLASLAQRRQWARYLEEYREDDADPAQRCGAFTARIELQRFEGLREAIVQQWLAATDSLLPCDAAFTWLRAQGALTPQLLDARIRTALAAGSTGLSKQLVLELAPPLAEPLRRWIALIEQPQTTIDGLIAAPDTPVERAALLDGWTRLARRNPDAALARWARLVHARHLSAADASPFALALALGLAWNRSPHALELFDRVAAADMDENAQEWHVRAALWNGDWARAAHVIAAMPESLRALSRWRYWEARVAEKQHERERAHALYAALLPTDNYYAVQAAARLHEQFAPHPQPLERDGSQVGALAAQPGFVRAYELLACGFDMQADAEWWSALSALDAGAQRQSVNLAADWGWYEKAIITAARQHFFEDYALLYPHPYDHAVAAGVRLTGLPDALIYATLRQESLYRADAVSTADALGLLQLKLATARKVAHRLGKAPPQRADLFDPAVNVPLGAAELKGLLERFDGQLPVALAGYNAGPNAAQRWLPRTPRDADVWIENIPYNETRTYVQRVLWHSVVFGWLASDTPQDTHDWLAKVSAPRAAA